MNFPSKSKIIEECKLALKAMEDQWMVIDGEFGPISPSGKFGDLAGAIEHGEDPEIERFRKFIREMESSDGF
ncbi:TPA: hypothetical protein QDZ80_000227 [Stenotrophomonas maltophilia]|nr:hypothetical protein [Stenotrophomonas maltophilia]